MTPEQIEATGNALIRFSSLELIIIGLDVILVFLIVFLGRRWLKYKSDKQHLDNKEVLAKISADNEENITRLNNEAQQRMQEKEIELRQLDAENNLLLKNITDRLDNHSEELKAISKRFDSMAKSIDHLFFTVSDQQEKYYKVSQGTLERILFIDSPKSKFDQLKAFYRLTAMGVNGRVQKKGMELISESESSKELWLDVISQKLDIDLLDKTYFENTMKLINSQIFNMQ